MTLLWRKKQKQNTSSGNTNSHCHFPGSYRKRYKVQQEQMRLLTKVSKVHSFVTFFQPTPPDKEHFGKVGKNAKFRGTMVTNFVTNFKDFPPKEKFPGNKIPKFHTFVHACTLESIYSSDKMRFLSRAQDKYKRSKITFERDIEF